MATSVEDTCQAWDVRIVGKVSDDGIDDEVIGHGGDIEHLRKYLPVERKTSCDYYSVRKTMESNNIYWMTDRTPHEALPMRETGYRQFFRLVTHKVGLWYEQHSTPNPNGVVPDPNITRIIKKSKFI